MQFRFCLFHVILVHLKIKHVLESTEMWFLRMMKTPWADRKENDSVLLAAKEQ
jgi:hypothetical protein